MLTRIEIENKPFLQLIFILALCLISVIIFSIIGLILSVVLYNFTPSSVHNMANLMENEVAGYKIVQLFGAIGLFLVPPILYGLITSKKSFQKLGFRLPNNPINYLLVLVLMIVCTPFISWVIEMNANLSFPDFMAEIETALKNSQDSAKKIQTAMLSVCGFWDLIYVSIIVVVIPAFGEELLFRGVLQKIFIGWTKRKHMGVWVTAFLFGTLHMQFYSFIPITLLGAVFGYIFLWSKSLWLPILGHFFNNGVVLYLSLKYPENLDELEASFFDDRVINTFFYVGSLLLSALIFYLIRKVNLSTKKEVVG